MGPRHSTHGQRSAGGGEISPARPVRSPPRHHAMAPDQSSLLEVLEALKGAEVDDRIRQAAETIYQALIEASSARVIGAASHGRTGWRNGHRPWTITTTAGDLELRIPKLRGGYSGHRAGQRGAAGQVWGWMPVRQVIPAGRPWSGQAGAPAFRSAERAGCRSSAIPLAGLGERRAG
jgi:Transposase, Mutator family